MSDAIARIKAHADALESVPHNKQFRADLYELLKAQPPCGADGAVLSHAELAEVIHVLVSDDSAPDYADRYFAIVRRLDALTLLAAQPAAPVAPATAAVPDGFVRVPAKCSRAMEGAFEDCAARGYEMAETYWEAMLAASQREGVKS